MENLGCRQVEDAHKGRTDAIVPLHQLNPEHIMILRTIAKFTLGAVSVASFAGMIAATIGGVAGAVTLGTGVSIMLLCGVLLIGSLMASVEI